MWPPRSPIMWECRATLPARLCLLLKGSARKQNGEAAPLADGAFDVDASAEQGGELPGDCETQPRPTDDAGVCLVHLREGLEDALDVLGRDPGSAVPHAEPVSLLARLESEIHAPILREFDGVAEE